MKTVYELSREQLAELKQNYLVQMAEETGDEELTTCDLAEADSIVSDAAIFEAYDGTIFTDDDFICTAGN